MGLSKWDIPTLRRNLSVMEGSLRTAGLERLSLDSVLRHQGRAQYPILAKVVEILREELHERLRAAEEREYRGRALEAIEKQKAERAAMFERDHPGVLEDSERDEPAYDVVARLNAVDEPPIGQDSPILRAMKNAAWHGLQRIGTDVLVEYLKLWITKHHDYGPENHAVWGCKGVLIRASDKLLRLKRSYFDEVSMENETIEDTWLDLIGYGLIGLIIERGLWPVTTLSKVIADMKAEAEAKKLTMPSGLLCPRCGSPDVQVYQAANAENRAWVRCGIECIACRVKIGGAMHVTTESLEVAVRRGIDEWRARHIWR